LNIGQIFSGLSSTAAVGQAIRSLIRNTRGTRRALLLELQKNINLIYLYTKDGAPIEKVAAKLELRHYERANQSGFDFNALKKRTVRTELVKDKPPLRPYAGWTTEQLFERIYLKIHNLKSIVAIDPKNERFRLHVRLLNILRLMLLLLQHLKT
jgi:hypothetical protein